VEYLQASVADLFKTYVPQDERDVAIRELLEARPARELSPSTDEP
jgi:hypothetical protein